MLGNEKNIVSVFVIGVLLVGTVIPSVISAGGYSEELMFEEAGIEETVILVYADNEVEIEEIGEYGEIIDVYGRNVLIETHSRYINELEQTYEINTLDYRNELSINGYQFDTSDELPNGDLDFEIKNHEIESEGIYIVDMIGPVNPEWRRELEEHGVEVINYQPNYAYEVVMTPEQAERVEELYFVDWVGAYQPEFKVHSEIEKALDENMLINVRLRPGYKRNNLNQIHSEFDVLGKEILPDAGSLLTVNIDSIEDVEGLAIENDVYYISPEIEPELHGEMDIQQLGGGMWFMDDEYETRTDLSPSPREGDPQEPYRKHGDYGAYINQMGYSGEGVTVAVADTGVGDGTVGDAGVEDFTDRVIGGYGFGTDEDNWADGHYHGTACTGLIVGDTYRGTAERWDDFDDGDMEYYMGQGLAYESEIFGTKIFSDGGDFLPSEYFPIIEEPAQRSDTYVHSNSWGSATMGSYVYTDEVYDQAVRDADRDTDENRPMVITVSAGNEGGRGDFEQETGSPGNAKNVITVGGNQPYNPGLGYENPENMYGSSSRGWTEDNRVKPDLIAPSESVIAHNTPLEGGGYLATSGTSFGNPLVAGAASVVVEWYEENHGVKPSPAMVRSILINTANELDPEVGNTRGHIPNRDEGWGVPDISKLERDDSVGFMFEDQESLLTTGDVDEHDIIFQPEDESEPLKITLVWTDDNALEGDSAGGTPTLKNNLDLEVISPSGEVYRGNAFNKTGGSVSDTGYTFSNTDTMELFDYNDDGRDDVNNVQNVHLDPDGLERGRYTIRVIGTNIPADSNNDGYANQDYALSVYNVPDDEVPDKRGEIVLNREEYKGDDVAEIMLDDVILEGEGTHDVTISSLDDNGGLLENKTVELTENENQLGVFNGYVQLTEDENEEGALYVEHGGEITVWYWDEDPGKPINMDTQDTSLFDNDDALSSSINSDIMVLDILSPEKLIHSNRQDIEARVYNMGGDDHEEVPLDTTITEMSFYDIVMEDLGYITGTSEDYGVEWDIRKHGSSMGENSWDFGDEDYGSHNPYMSWLISPAIDLEDESDDITLTFDHWRSFYGEPGAEFDGGNVKISTESPEGPWELIHPEEGYDGTINGRDSPIEGEPAWCYEIEEWETATFDLTDYAGEEIYLNWTAGIHDGFGNREGWRIDNIQISDGGEVEYHDDLLIDIESGEDTNVQFEDWIPSGEGGYQMKTSVLSSEHGDDILDSLTKNILVEDIHDVGVTEILSPYENVNSVGSHSVKALIENFGTVDQTDVPVETRIKEQILALSEDFKYEIPDEWAIENTTEEKYTWHHFERSLLPDPESAYIVGREPISQDEWLMTPTLDITGYDHMTIELDQEVDSRYDSNARIKVSNDNGYSWNVIEEWSSGETMEGVYERKISEYVEGEDEIQFAFVFESPVTDGPMNWDAWSIYDIDINNLQSEYSSNTVVDVDAEDNVSAEFEDWTPSDEGDYKMYTSTELEDDINPHNDLSTREIEVVDIHDVGVNEIISPTENAVINETTDVKAEVENFGTFDEEDVPVRTDIKKGIFSYYTEDFEQEIPDDWTIKNTTEEPGTWHHDTTYESPGAHLYGQNDVDQNEWLISPVIEMESDAKDISVTIDQYLYSAELNGDSWGRVKVSADSGETWDLVEEWGGKCGLKSGEYEIDLPTNIEGEEEIQLAFVWDSTDDPEYGERDYWWLFEARIDYREIIYSDSLELDLAQKENSTISFSDWEPSETGEYVIEVKTDLEGDDYPFNDFESETFSVIDRIHDIGVEQIISPESQVWEGTQSIKAEITNHGHYDEEDLKVYANVSDLNKFMKEDFSNNFPPSGWGTDDWMQSYSDWAGGEAPEARLSSWSVQGGYSYLRTSHMDTEHADDLVLYFNSHLRHFMGPIECRVLARSEIGEQWDDVTPWENPVESDIEVEKYVLDITEYIGQGTQIMFEFEGNPNNFHQWYIDNVRFDVGIEGEYSDDITVDLARGESATVDFEEWTPSEPGNYSVSVTAHHPEDEHPHSAMHRKNVFVKEIIHDLEASSIDEPEEPIYGFEERDVKGTVSNVGNQNLTDATVDFTIDPVYKEVPLEEDFDDGLPADWTVEDRDGNDNTWTDEHGDYMFVEALDDFENDILWTEITDCTFGDHRVTLEFYSESKGQTVRDLLISTDGGETSQRIALNISDGQNTIDITRWALGEENVVIGWEFFSQTGAEGEYWLIDDVKVINEQTTEEYHSTAMIDELNVTEDIQIQFEEWTPDISSQEYVVTMKVEHDDDDNLDNTEIVERIFVEEYSTPNLPEDPKPLDGAENVDHSPLFSVNVSHPNQRDMDVTFYILDEENNEIENRTAEDIESGTRAQVRFLLLEPSSTFKWYVEIYDGIDSIESEQWEFTTYTPEGRWNTDSARINANPPETVRNLEVDWDDDVWDVTGNEITWDASPDDGSGEDDTDYYVIFRSESENGPWDETTRIDTVEANGTESYTYLDYDKAYDGKTWNYVVRAVDRVGNKDMNENSVSEPPTPLATDPEPMDGFETDELVQELSVDVSSPTGDPLDVKFYEGRTRILIGEERGVTDGRVETTWELGEDQSGLDHHWYVVVSYQDNNIGDIVPEVPEDPEMGEWHWLYDHEHRTPSNNGIGLLSEGIWHGAILMDLSDEIGNEITDVAYYDYQEAGNWARAHVARDDNGAPAEPWEASSEEYEPTGAGWVYLGLNESVEIEGSGKYWIVMEIHDFGRGSYPFGCIDPFVEDGQYYNDGDPHDPDDWGDFGYWGIGGALSLEAHVQPPSEDPSPSPPEFDVAVVDEVNWHENLTEAKLDHHLPDNYNVDTLESNDLIEEMDNYDTFVIQRFGSDSLASTFLDSLNDDQGVVYLDSAQGGTEEAFSDGMYRLHNLRDDPEVRDEESLDTSPPTTMDINVDHPIFKGIGRVGDTIPIYTGRRNYGSWFDNYSGETLAEVDYGGGFEGSGVGINDFEKEILLPVKSIDFNSRANDPGWTLEADRLLSNSVRHLNDDLEYESFGWSFHLEDRIDPVADAGDDIEAKQGDTITLDGSASTDNVIVREWKWTIEDPTGEKTVKYGETVDYTLPYALTYEVELTVYDQAGNTDTDIIEIYAVDTEDPIADAGVPGQTRVDQQYTLDATGSTDNVEIVDYIWTITGITEESEGHEEVVEGEKVEYFFPYEGVYDITLEVLDEEQNSDIDQTSVIVNPSVHDLVIDTVGEGYVSLNPHRDEYENGTEIELQANPRDGWVFKEWTGDYEGTDNEIMINMDQNKEITAHFVKDANFELSILSSPDEVKSDEEVVVEYFVENTGDIEDNQILEFIIDEEIVDTQEVFLGPQDTYEGEFIWDTEGENFGKYTLEIRGTDDYASQIITILDEGRFEVNVAETHLEVLEGDPVLVEYTVTNTGELEKIGTVNIKINGEVMEEESITLEPGEILRREFTWETEEGDAGDYEMVIEIGDSELSETDSESVNITIEEDDTEDVDDDFPTHWIIIAILSSIVVILAIALLNQTKKQREEKGKENTLEKEENGLRSVDLEETDLESDEDIER